MSKISEMSKKYNLHSWSAQGKLNPMTVTKADGIYFWDDEGKKYYDMSSQLVNSNLGHCNKAVVEAIKAQADKMPYMGPGYAVDVRSEAAKKIVEFAGPDYEGAKIFFTNAGAEANENAVKMAKTFTGRWKFFSMYRSYHGATYATSSLCGEPRRWIAEPGAPGFIHFEGPYAYRAPKACKFESEADVTAYYLELLETQIQYENPQAIAAIFVESVVGTNGVLIPPNGYLKGVQEICRRYGILLVCDEVMAGFYRTGSRFAFMQFDIKPDIITFAKGSTCGYVPLGGVIAKKEIADYFDDHKMFCGLTYSAHLMGCAAAVATLDEYERLGIEANVKKQGKILAELLGAIEKKHKSVGEVRHIGLFAMLDLVKDKATRAPLVPFNSDPEGLMPKILGMLKAEGFVTYSHENMIAVSPPLIITEQELRDAVQILDKVLDSVDAMV
ncbi:MAG: aminotransferase class III-fold pyridoxal phosphate-dependent enzyme [Clostridiales Family XIII bacterium]|jgi:taurine--2-oxoglutarate transaminase|nr:aminotransferase class III-fold pyridoxal phosphate-dependent enzyme [Clostridiales Family XIII bacterium]